MVFKIQRSNNPLVTSNNDSDVIGTSRNNETDQSATSIKQQPRENGFSLDIAGQMGGYVKARMGETKLQGDALAAKLQSQIATRSGEEIAPSDLTKTSKGVRTNQNEPDNNK